ncbi:hypothetical protein FIM02_00400 [SAR202 cluster bacterium AD-802-E10_MRT_200m]|nr:hypothetical protein [SAR202 cluster bacterium AD-802-E10_MRT_200m]
MITQRRVFQAKIGQAVHVVAKMKEFQPLFEKHCGPTTRIYTDLFSGNTDRIVWEFDAESLGGLENIFWAAGQDEDYQKAYESWYESLKPLIEVATVELWNKEM